MLLIRCYNGFGTGWKRTARCLPEYLAADAPDVLTCLLKGHTVVRWLQRTAAVAFPYYSRPWVPANERPSYSLLSPQGKVDLSTGTYHRNTTTSSRHLKCERLESTESVTLRPLSGANLRTIAAKLKEDNPHQANSKNMLKKSIEYEYIQQLC